MTMKSLFLLMTLMVATTTTDATITRQECTDQGGTIVGDIGDGAIFQPDYLCASTNEAPTDAVVAGAGEPIASEGEVCCGGTGPGIEDNSGEVPPGGGSELPPPGNATTPEGVPGPTLDTDAETPSNPEFNDPGAAGDPGVGVTAVKCREGGHVVEGKVADVPHEGYICKSNGQAPLNPIVVAQDLEVTAGSEVCCGAGTAAATDDSGANANNIRGVYGMIVALGALFLVI